jgi:hypothetical protein
MSGKDKFNSKLYESSRIEYFKLHSIEMSGENNGFYGKTHSIESKTKMSEAQRGEKNHMFGKTGELCHNFGKLHTEETKTKMSESHKGEKCYMFGKTGKLSNNFGRMWVFNEKLFQNKFIKVEEFQFLEDEWKEGRKQSICPHCEKAGSTIMKRYHFDNCKFIKILDEDENV